MPRGKRLRLILMASALVHYSFDGWQTAADVRTRDTRLGTHVVDLAADRLAVGSEIVFTFHWTQEQRWEGADFSVVVEQ